MPSWPVVTKRGSWLNAALYYRYAKNSREVKAIAESFDGPGIFVTHAKVSLQTIDLATQLLKIKDQYVGLSL